MMKGFGSLSGNSMSTEKTDWFVKFKEERKKNEKLVQKIVDCTLNSFYSHYLFYSELKIRARSESELPRI